MDRAGLTCAYKFKLDSLRDDARGYPAARRFREAAAERACFESAAGDAALPPSLFRAANVARDRLAEGFLVAPLRALAESRSACFRACSEVVPLFGGASFTPARRAFESPIAIACFVDRAPCFPSRI